MICQVAGIGLDELVCTQRESGGYQCERTDPHGASDTHWVGKHTIGHAIVGNGHTCWYDAID